MSEPQKPTDLNGWTILTYVLAALTAIDFFFGRYTSESDGSCNGLAVLFGNVCEEHTGIVLARLVIGGGLAVGAWMMAERAKEPKQPGST